MNRKLPVTYSCSGCSSAAQMANWIALQLTQEGIAEMSCIAGVGGGVESLVKKAKSADIVIGIDGCPLHCVESCLKKENVEATLHFDLSEMGVKKRLHQTFDLQEAEEVKRRIIRILKNKGIQRPSATRPHPVVRTIK